MADNITVTPGTGATIAADDVGSALHQRVKVEWGPDGTVNETDIATGKPLPVQLRASTGQTLSDTTGILISTSQISALGQTVSTGSSPVVLASDQSKIPVQGNTAHDGVDTDKPIKIGGFAKAAAPADVSADGDVTNAWYLRNGAAATVITAAGALISATSNALDVNVKSVTGTAIPVTDNGGSLTVDNAGTFVTQSTSSGDVSAGSSDSGNPVKVGGKATNVEPTALTTGQRANLITDLVGKLIVLPYANPENFVSGVITSAMTGTTSTSLIAAPASGLRNYITQITVSNAHATVGTDIIIQDGSGGTTLYNIPAAAVYGGSVITFPTPLRQPTTATAIFCANVTTGASTKVSASGYKGV